VRVEGGWNLGRGSDISSDVPSGTNTKDLVSYNTELEYKNRFSRCFTFS